jgi:lipopolysaccharide export system permease protein
MKLTIIDRYIARELLSTFLAVVFVLLIIVLSTEIVHLLKWLSQGVIPISAFLAYLLNSLFEFGVILIPLSLLMAILLAFGRLYRDSEMAALSSSGIGPWQLYRPLMLVAVPVTLLLMLLLLYIKPIITYQRALISAEVQSRAEVDTLMVGQFNRSSENAVLFLESEDKHNNRIQNVFFHQKRDTGNHVDLARSTSTWYDSDQRRYMMMHNGVHYTGEPGKADYRIIEYQDYGVHIDKKAVHVHLSEKSKSVAELWQSDNLVDKAELQWRLTLPLATIIVAFMALPLSYTTPRSGRYSKLALALIIYLVYSNMLSISDTWIVQGKVPVWVGTWWVHLVAIAIMLLMFWRQGYFAGLQQKRGGKA